MAKRRVKKVVQPNIRDRVVKSVWNGAGTDDIQAQITMVTFQNEQRKEEIDRLQRRLTILRVFLKMGNGEINILERIVESRI